MSIQRTGYSIEAASNQEQTEGEIHLIVAFDGKYTALKDSLLMILGAWNHAMLENGFDPVRAIKDFQDNEKKTLQ